MTVAAQDSYAFRVAASDAAEPAETPRKMYADWFARMKERRKYPQWMNSREYTDRWDRARPALGNTVADRYLTPTTSDRARAHANRCWRAGGGRGQCAERYGRRLTATVQRAGHTHHHTRQR